MKESLFRILKYRPLVRLAVVLGLKSKNTAYRYAGRSDLRNYLEPDELHPKHRIMKYHDWFTGRLQ